MKLSKEITDLMGKKVDYCRAKQQENATTELHRGKGVVVGIIIGLARRIQIMVKDEAEDSSKAFTLDQLCVEPTDEDANAYFAHHVKLKTIVEDHNKAQREREQEKIKEVDDLNAQMFGEPLEV